MAAAFNKLFEKNKQSFNIIYRFINRDFYYPFVIGLPESFFFFLIIIFFLFGDSTWCLQTVVAGVEKV